MYHLKKQRYIRYNTCYIYYKLNCGGFLPQNSIGLGRSCAKRAQNIDKTNCLIIVGDGAELVNKHYNLPDGVFALSSGGGCTSLGGEKIHAWT